MSFSLTSAMFSFIFKLHCIFFICCAEIRQKYNERENVAAIFSFGSRTVGLKVGDRSLFIP